MNAENATSDSKNHTLVVTLKATYRYPYMGGLVGTDFSRTVVDTFCASSRNEIVGLVDAAFKDIMERMYRAHDNNGNKPNWVEDESVGIPVWAMDYHRKARKRVLDATWDNVHDGFSEKVLFKRGNAPEEFNHHSSEVAGVPSTLEITVSRKEDETKDDTDDNVNNGGKDPSEGQHTDPLSDSDIIETVDRITQTLKLLTHCAKSKDAINRSDMLDYIDDLKSGLDSVLNDETKAS